MTLLVVSGPPGAGKSTVAAIIAERDPRSVVVEGDRFFNFLASGRIEPWLREANPQNDIVLEAAAAATGRFVHHEYATVYDGVLGPTLLPAFLETTGLASLHYVVLLPSVELCVDRVTRRTLHHFHDGPATRKMHDQFVRAEIASRHVVRSDAPPELLATEIVERRDRGQLVYPDSQGV